MWKITPSEAYFIHDELTAWCFNRAVALFGTSVEEDIRKATYGAKSQEQSQTTAMHILRKWLNDTNTTGLFKDPIAGR